ncbi:MAG TPA: peptidylprolyl isomerase [Candidatus Acidoferrum sp.]|nr:peptidylprolyl isomerase [Candidatus Acidoferrum sp.]
MKTRGGLLGALLLASLLAGCAAQSWVPGWVPLVGKKKETAPPTRTVTPGAEMMPAPVVGQEVTKPAPAETDESVADRIVAVVNNDAITLAELQESVLMFRQENRQNLQVSDEELSRQFLSRLIDSRLQLQEAERDKITVDEVELNEEITERMKRFGSKTLDEFETLIKGQGLTVEAVRKRLRDSIRVSKVIRRRVALRVSVTDTEISQYIEENRGKLETGLSYHARHILLVPDSETDAGWEGARIRAEMIRSQVGDGADFGELAKQTSRDASAKEGGDLGSLRRGELSQEIEDQILALRSGEVSRPYRSSLGYHVFRLESKETLDGETIQRVRQQVREILYRQKYDARMEAWLKEIKQRAIIEVRM